MRRRTLFALALGSALAMMGGVTRAATTLFTTQGDFTGWSGSPQFNVTPSAAADIDGSSTNGLGNTGSAGGAGGLSATWVSGSFDYIFSQGEQGNAPFLAAIGSSGTIAVDYTKPPAGGGSFFQLGVVLNYPSHFDQDFGGAEINNGNGTFTQLIPYTASIPVSPSFFQLGVIYNSNFTTSPFTIDDIRLLPEPASLSFLAVSGLMIKRRRR